MDIIESIGYGLKRGLDDGDVHDNVPPSKKRQKLKERTEAGIENEFGVQPTSGSKLQLDDFLAPLESTSSLHALRKSTKLLTKSDALAAPLPQRTKDKLDREAAYEKTRDEVDKWKATMKRIKEADHLNFPLQVPQKVNPTNSQLVAKFKPSSDLESAVDRLLRAAQIRDEKDIMEAEELMMNKLSVEDAAERLAELRKKRDLIFRAEAKLKRIAKIKSKTYRKIHRKGNEKMKRLLKEAEGLDQADEDEERMKHEMQRARERATLRHKNTSSWTKAPKSDVDQRQEIEEMLEKDERLRAGIQGIGRSEEDVDEDEDIEGGLDGIKASAFEELQRLERDNSADTPKDKEKGVFSMKFMQDAMAREAKRVGEAADDFRKELSRMGGDGDGADEEEANDEDEANEPNGVQSQRIGGRMTFYPGQTTVASRPIAPSDSSSTLKSSEPALQSPVVVSQVTRRSSPPTPQDKPIMIPSISPPPEPQPPKTDVNPWLAGHQNVTLVRSRRKNEILIEKDSVDADKSRHRLKKQQMKRTEEQEEARYDAIVEISLDNVLRLPSDVSDNDEARQGKSAKTTDKEPTPLNGRQVDTGSADTDSENEIEAQEQELQGKRKGKGKAFKQRDLVALAFAGDNVVQEFDKLKKKEVEANAPREEDLTLPGWGSWGGVGTKPNPRAKKIVKSVAGIDPTSRADHGKPHLIISEKKDKKAAKYLTKDLPYPYTSKAQFERSLEVPVGTEWNTRVGFQRYTLPRVVKKMGTVIEPLEKLF